MWAEADHMVFRPAVMATVVVAHARLSFSLAFVVGRETFTTKALGVVKAFAFTALALEVTFANGV